MNLLQMIELAVHREVLDEFYMQKNARQPWNYRLLDEGLQGEVIQVVKENLIPFLELSKKNALWKGDSEYLLRIGLKSLFAVLIHVPKNKQEIVLQTCKLAIGDRLEWKTWESFVHSF